MDKQQLKDLRSLARTINSDARRIKKAVNVIQALNGFSGDGNGELHEAARRELATATASLRTSLDRIADVVGETAVESTSDTVPF